MLLPFAAHVIVVRSCECPLLFVALSVRQALSSGCDLDTDKSMVTEGGDSGLDV